MIEWTDSNGILMIFMKYLSFGLNDNKCFNSTMKLILKQNTEAYRHGQLNLDSHSTMRDQNRLSMSVHQLILLFLQSNC